MKCLAAIHRLIALGRGLDCHVSPTEVTAEGELFDTTLELRDAAGNTLSTTDDTPTSKDARLVYTLPETRFYTIVITGWNDKTDSYELMVSR